MQVKFDAMLEHLTKMVFALLLSQQRPLMKRVNIDHAFRRGASYHKVIGESDAIDRYPNTLANLHIQQSQRNRQPGMLFQYLIEIAIIRVLVIILIAAKLFLTEQHLVYRVQNGQRIYFWR